MRASQIVVGLLLLAMGAVIGYAWKALGLGLVLVVALLALVSFALGIYFERYRSRPDGPPPER